MLASALVASISHPVEPPAVHPLRRPLRPAARALLAIVYRFERPAAVRGGHMFRHNSQLARRPREQESGYMSSADGRDGDLDFDDEDGSEDDAMTNCWQS